MDAMVTLSSCDKINPACLMAAARLDIPTICVPGGAGFREIYFNPNYMGIDQESYAGFYEKTSCVACGTLGACDLMGTAKFTVCPSIVRVTATPTTSALMLSTGPPIAPVETGAEI